MHINVRMISYILYYTSVLHFQLVQSEGTDEFWTSSMFTIQYCFSTAFTFEYDFLREIKYDA